MIKRYEVRQESPYDTNEYVLLESFHSEREARNYCWNWNKNAQPEFGDAVITDTITKKRIEAYPYEPVY